MLNRPLNVLFVCLGNICRSPMAEGLFLHHLQQAGLDEHFHVESAGTGNWHVGDLPDERMRATAKNHGIVLASRAQQIKPAHLEQFDHILVMDQSNRSNVLALASTDTQRDKVQLMRAYDPQLPVPQEAEVPDPYFGGQDGFEEVYAILHRSTRQLLTSLSEAHGLPLPK